MGRSTENHQLRQTEHRKNSDYKLHCEACKVGMNNSNKKQYISPDRISYNYSTKKGKYLMCTDCKFKFEHEDPLLLFQLKFKKEKGEKYDKAMLKELKERREFSQEDYKDWKKE